MLIENPEAFKSWLTSVLEPLCEADPEALAKYVYALVKKDRPVDMLRESMVEQLDVFLQNETKPFVELLFKTLETQEYILPTAIPNANPPNPNPPAVVKSEPPAEVCPSKEVKAIIPVSSLPDLTVDVNGTAPAAKKDKEPEPPTTTTAAHRKDRDREHKKTDLDKEDKGVRATRPRHRSSSRNRSRSRSWERSRRSRSRERSRERERRERSRPWRNKSPPRRYERRRSRSNSPNVPRRSRSPRHNYRGRYRNRSPPRSLSRSRSRSLEKHSDKDKVRDPKDSNKEPLSGAGTPTQDSNHGDTDMRLTSSTQSIQSVVAANTAEGSVAPPQGATTVAGVFPSKRRCRDFDEKGYCMRGELCPYDHGVDPVVLEDTALSSVLTFGPNGQPPIDGAPGPGMLPPPMIRPSHVMHPHHMPPRQMHPMPPEYNPSAPSMWNPRARFGGAPMNLPGAPPRGGMFHAPHLQPGVGHIAGGPGHNHVQRELISVPVHDNASDNNFPRRNDYPVENQDNNNQLKKKTGFDFSRVGPRTKNPVNCSLELKKVPRGLNNITHLNNHFSKFGKIVNIQVSYEGDPEAALITFSSHAEANAAYRSTEAVLNNRFIKVFWHNNNEGKQENVPPQRSIKDRLGQQVGPTASISGGNKVLNLVQPKATNSTGTPASNDSRNDKAANSSNSFNKLYIPNAKPASQESKAQANSVLQKKQEIIAVKKRQEEARKDMAKMNQDLVKRTHKLLEEQIAHQKQLIEKLEKGNVQGQKKEELKEAIQKLQQSIEDIRKSLMASVKQKAANQIIHAAKITQARKSKEEAQKEFLDAELDLITKQQEGADTSALQKKVSELKARALSLGNTPKITRGSLALRLPRGNKYLKIQRRSFAHQSVDHRPTKLLVSGYESEEKTDVVAHFAKFGEILDYISDDSTPSVILNFKTRKEAEMAVLKGKHFQDRTLSVTWCTSSQLNSQMSGNRNTARTVLLNDSDEDRLLESTITEEEDGVGGADLTADLNEEALLQDDEEEEEENEEDRSWRR